MIVWVPSNNDSYYCYSPTNHDDISNARNRSIIRICSFVIIKYTILYIILCWFNTLPEFCGQMLDTIVCSSLHFGLSLHMLRESNLFSIACPKVGCFVGFASFSSGFVFSEIYHFMFVAFEPYFDGFFSSFTALIFRTLDFFVLFLSTLFFFRSCHYCRCKRCSSVRHFVCTFIHIYLV